jgi:hypothetical protein
MPDDPDAREKTVTPSPKPRYPTLGRPWPKGVSGNPEGRRIEQPGIKEVRALAQSYSVAAIETLAAIMKNGRTPAAVRVAAAQALLDRGYGKPVQAVEHAGPSGERLFQPEELRTITDAQLARLVAVARDIRAELDGNGGPPS